MGEHDYYGKRIMQLAAGADYGPARQISFGKTRGGATIDGVVGDTIAVEIESKNSKQVRGAALDLIMHPHKKKLLVLVPMHMGNAQLCQEQCDNILGTFVAREDYRVVLLRGTGSHPKEGLDVELVRSALAELGFPSSLAA